MRIASNNHDSLEEWVRSFGGTALLGLVCALLLFGKFLHYICQRRGLVLGFFVIPPAIISGLVGLIWFMIVSHTDPIMAEDLRWGLEAMRRNLVSFVFSAFALGLVCTKTNSLHTTSLFNITMSVIHEGMPMMVYSQILLWGQTSCCLAVHLLLYAGREPENGAIGPVGTVEGLSSLFPVLVPLGAEAGVDVASLLGVEGEGLKVVANAQALALPIVCIVGIIAFSLKPLLLQGGYLGPQYTREAKERAGMRDGQAEAFTRPLPPAPIRSFSHEDFREEREELNEEGRIEQASLGTHLSLISLAVFFSFALSLFFHYLEERLHIPRAPLSGMRLFKVSMGCAVGTMTLLMKHKVMRFRREWFMRMGGLLLDLLLISSLMKGAGEIDTRCLLFICVCLMWNLYCFSFLARKIFPNYWYERGLTLWGDSMGRAYTGLMFLRVMDPQCLSPVPWAYASKLMLFLMPSSGAKATVLRGLVKGGGGVGGATIVSLFVLSTWYAISLSFIPVEKEKKEEQSSLLVREMDGGEEGGNSPTPGNNFSSSSGKLANRSSRAKMSYADLVDAVEEIERGVSAGGLEGGRCKGGESSILSLQQVESLALLLPETKQTNYWTLGYSLRTHGALLSTLLSRCSSPPFPCIVIIEDSWGHVFGGYLSPSLQERKGYYGNGESFVFSVLPSLRAFHWTGRNSFFALSTPQCLAMGGGGEGYAWQVDDELDTGVSNRSDTYDNPVLASHELFKCLNVEVWLMDSVGVGCDI